MNRDQISKDIEQIVSSSFENGIIISDLANRIIEYFEKNNLANLYRAEELTHEKMKQAFYRGGKQ